jgi:type VI secretion system protein ImpJ
MRRLQPVIWSKGTFLTPQHLQHQDRFVESVIQFRTEALSFRPWGFLELQVDQESLAAGRLAIARASGIFPDGLAFDIPDADAAPASKPLAQFFEAEQKDMTVYLAIPAYRDRGLNVSVGGENADTRYLAEVTTVRDETSAQSEKPLQIARKNFRLLVEGEVRQGTPALKVARITKTEAETFQLDPQFVPPLLDIAANEYLLAIARRLVEILLARSSMLSGTRRQRNQSLADFTASDIANFWLLYTINTHVPLLRHLFETKQGHPEELFSLMLSVAGSLTTFSLEIHPRDLPSYDHNDLGACFGALDEKLRNLLETVVPANFVSLPLKLVQPSIYATALDDDKYLVNTKMYLAVSAEVSEADLISKAPQLVKVCSANHIEHLVKHALPGVQLTHVPAPPSSIPVKLTHQYFSLNQTGLSWEAIGRARNVAAYVPGDLPNAQLELIILLPQAG